MLFGYMGDIENSPLKEKWEMNWKSALRALQGLGPTFDNIRPSSFF
jgi:hypothetical protein